jgi:hypothetical protein
VTLRRLELLRLLQAEGINCYRVWPLLEPAPLDACYPIFLRIADDHHGARSPLLNNPEELARELNRLRSQGTRLENWIACEYAGWKRPDGVFAKHAAFCIARGILFAGHWQVKNPEIFREDLLEEERVYIDKNPHAPFLQRVFALAGVDYGRVDYGVDAQGRLSIWEINTNPHIFSLAIAGSPHRVKINGAWASLFADRIRGLNRQVPHIPFAAGWGTRMYWIFLNRCRPRWGAGKLEKFLRFHAFNRLIRMARRFSSAGADHRIPERDKKKGIHYAVTHDGIEIPVIDITHPAFSLPVDEPKGWRVLGRLSGLVWKIYHRLFRHRSNLWRRMNGAEGTFLPGLDTYLLKLGPENLGGGYAHPIDRSMASSALGQALRSRLWDMAHFLAEAAAPRLAAKPGSPLYFINIGGGPGMDSLNALILLAQSHPDQLRGRKIRIEVLDLKPEGPEFGARALAALRAEGGPLRDLDVEFRFQLYDWADGRPLRILLEERARVDAVIAPSSEGALFSYASDSDIRNHLELLREVTPQAIFLVASMVRSKPADHSRPRQGLALTSRSWEDLKALVQKSGWFVDRENHTAFSHHFRLIRI